MTYRSETDETLVLLTLAGEQTAYETLVTRWQSAVIASARAVTHSTFMAEDAAQDALVTAWMKLNTLAEPRKFGAWVCRIARNCARNTVIRCSRYVPTDFSEGPELSDEGTQDPAALSVLKEERDGVAGIVDGLSDRVRTIIRLHYYENLSVAEIADRMHITAGTVKRQLFDGRKQIRKELCAMDETYTDTLVQRVMKKVEELKTWQVKNDKTGFETVYREVLAEIGELPECAGKQHALADVLMRGWWWLPGKKNDALLARIADAAMEGKNEEVMTFIAMREDFRVYSGEQIAFIRDKQIPRLEKAGFVKALGREWYRLADACFGENRTEEGNAALDTAERILEPGDPYRVLIPMEREIRKRLTSRYAGVNKNRYCIGAAVTEYRLLDGEYRFWEDNGTREGYLVSFDRNGSDLFRNASLCDGHFFADLPRGGTFTGSDGTTLSFLSDSETADTPAGRFEGCALWEVRHRSDFQKTVCRTYYRDGVGIVRQEHTVDGVTDVRMLKNFRIKDGGGMLPLAAGNTWEYVTQYPADIVRAETVLTVAFADDTRVLLTCFYDTERLGYDKTSWADAVQEIACEYCTEENGSEHLCDVSGAVERAERLAVTPYEKAYTKAAVSVIRRIFDTDPSCKPDCAATGHWNFFERRYFRRKGDCLAETGYNGRWCFEWKNTDNAFSQQPLLYNDIFGLLQDAADAVWSDEWRVGMSVSAEHNKYDRAVRTDITCVDGGTVTTKAGTFEHCLRLCLNVTGLEDAAGLSYRGGKRFYDFAPGVGIVRTECEYGGGTGKAVYELVSYTGTGDGYFPLADSMTRRYEAQNLTDGYVGAAEYAFVSDGDGDIAVFTDRTGIREKLPPITQ